MWPKNIEFIKSLGADKVIDYTDTESIKELDEYDFILDAVGKAKTSNLKGACVNALTENGKYVSIDDKLLELTSDRLNLISKIVETGRIKPVIDKIFQFEQIVEAHKYVEIGHKRGNVAITVNKENDR